MPNPPYDFEASITAPNGISVHVSISIPAAEAWTEAGARADVTAVAVIAQSVASDAIKQVTEARNEVPF